LSLALVNEVRRATVVVSLTLVLSCLWSLGLVGLVCFGFFLTVAEFTTGTVGFAVFVSATLGRVVLLRILI
jgi:hypothetical protein